MTLVVILPAFLEAELGRMFEFDVAVVSVFSFEVSFGGCLGCATGFFSSFLGGSSFFGASFLGGAICKFSFFI